MVRRARIVLAFAALCAGGAGCNPPECMTAGPSALIAQAKLLRLDVYDGDHCAGSRLAAGSPAPILTRSFAPGAAVTLDVPPGRRTFLLSAFADAGGAVLLGTGCAAVDVQAGGQPCIDLTVAAAPDLGPDLACGGDGACPCLANPDDCPHAQYCASGTCATGCKDDGDCTGQSVPDGGVAMPRCQTTRHTCVECLTPADCPVGKLCSPGNACVDGCDPGQNKLCANGLSCCGGFCVDTRTDPANCSTCGKACTGAQTLCCNSACADPLTDAGHCGGCSTVCSTVNATAGCSAGGCTWACAAGFAHCSGGNSGCETAITTTSNCGGCGNACNVANATAAMCNGTACAYTCKGGFGDCLRIGADTDGCETSLDTLQNCSACGAACDTVHSMGAMCNGATCTYAGCLAGYGDCAMAAPDADGCETNFSSPGNCGACGRACDAAHSNGASCSAGACSYASCKSGFADCAGMPPDLDGCETPTTTTSNCGGCGNVCSVANANSAMCDGTSCSYSCKAGFADCVNTPPDVNGCETATTTTANCGGCGNACTLNHASADACNGTSCSYTCSPGFGDCASAAPDLDGCETSLTTIANCGGCGRACDTVESNGASCNGGLCQYTSCKAGFADCSVAGGDVDGCETPTTTTTNCGGCGNVCTLNHATAAGCNGTSCSYTCAAGFADCVKNGADLDGCESSLSSTSSCSGCGVVCDTVHSNGAACNGLTCSYASCKAGFVDCNTTAPDENGCESQLHPNGLGQTYVDCADPLGVPGMPAGYNLNMATFARAASTIVGTDGAATCGAANCLYRQAIASCAVWCYSTTIAGYVFLNNADATCFCPDATDAQWN